MRTVVEAITMEGANDATEIDRIKQTTNTDDVVCNLAAVSEHTLTTSCLRLHPTICTDTRTIFFDLDNTLYSKHLGIHEEVGQRISLFFQTCLGLPEEECHELRNKYLLDYGLAIKGLLSNFQINPLEYDEFVDGGLNLEAKLKKDIQLIDNLQSIKARKWVFTNAGLRHARRVLKLLEIEDLFEGIVYCDYCEPNFPAKPDRLGFIRAMRCAGVDKMEDCWFVDDSKNNIRTALELGWHAVYLEEFEDTSKMLLDSNAADDKIKSIRGLSELQSVFPELYKTRF